MEYKGGFLLVLPFLMALVLFAGFSSFKNGKTTTSTSESLALSSKTISNPVLWTTCECPDETSSRNCASTEFPVLGGVDFVNYFTAYKNADGSYNETEYGVMGSSSHSSTHNGYIYYFVSDSNKVMFDASPSSYIPQYGGFCTWGVVGECLFPTLI
jgi:YHS domain-containing protein